MKQTQFHGLSLKDRLYARIERQKGCWEWTGSRDKHSYGRMNIKNRPVLVHRISWEIHFGPIPKGLFVLHHCDNPPCVRPEHLYLGTQLHNVRDMIRKGRSRQGHVFGEKHGKSKLTEKQVVEIRNSKENTVITATRYGVSHTTISDVRNRKIWTHI